MKNILIVEDDKSSMIMYKIFLKDRYNIFSSENSDIENILKENKIDLILLDIRILPIDGMTLSKTIREKYPNIKIIMQTAAIDLNTKRHGPSFDLLLEKPLSASVLLTSIKDILLN